MSRKFVLLCTTLTLFAVFADDSLEAQSRTLLPNDFGVELLGQGVLYSFSYQRMVVPRVGLQAGFSGLGGSAADASVVIVPLSAKFYFASGNASPFITGGIVILSGSVDSGPVESETFSNLGAGLEFRSTGGFLFRGTVYALIVEGEYLVWPGLHVGYAF